MTLSILYNFQCLCDHLVVNKFMRKLTHSGQGDYLASTDPVGKITSTHSFQARDLRVHCVFYIPIHTG